MLQDTEAWSEHGLQAWAGMDEDQAHEFMHELGWDQTQLHPTDTAIGYKKDERGDPQYASTAQGDRRTVYTHMLGYDVDQDLVRHGRTTDGIELSYDRKTRKKLQRTYPRAAEHF